MTLAASDAGRTAMRFVLTTVERAAEGAAWLVGDDEARAAWLELRNKVEAFRVFEHADALLDARFDEHSIARLIERAGRLPPPRSVWAAEGVGYHATAAACGPGRVPRDLLASIIGASSETPPPHAMSLDAMSLDAMSRHPMSPRWALIPLHAGLGAALGAHVLDAVRGGGSRLSMRQAIARFHGLCVANAEPAHLDVALEAFGFAARGLFADMMPAIVAELRAESPRLLPLLWHGVGRAIYFAPSSSIPVADTRRRVMEDVMSTATVADSARANTIAGFAWAVTLVNLRDPIAIEPFMADAMRLGIARPFAHGIHDALDAWRRCAPGDPTLAAFVAHRPADARRRDAWTLVLRAAAPRSSRVAGDLFQTTGDSERADERGDGRG